jgi:site-specific DNA-methyltransferase (adenine-specific)
MNDEWTTGQAEMAWTNLDRPIRVFRMATVEQEWCKKSVGSKGHPTQKPLALMLWCFKWVSGTTVLDPFMGSGTTLVAAKNLGRRAIGIEIEERYCEIAAKRLAQEVMAL